MTAEVLGGHLQVKPSTIKQWHLSGKIPGVRISSNVLRFDVDEVIAALKVRNNGLEER